MSTKALSVVVATVVALLMVDSAAALSADWWDNSWHYRINVTVNTSIYNRTDWPIEVPINFTDLGLQDTFDNNSVRVIQYNGTNVSGEIISQFDRGEFYDNATNAYGEVVWLLNGTIPNNTILEYFIYFDSVNFGLKAAPSYDSFLEFESESASTFGLNNSKIAVRVHTDAGNAGGEFNHTSGMYFAQFNVSGDIIFNANSPTALPIEYIRYSDEGQTAFYNYNFTNNFVVENSGPVRITIKQQGDEVEWGVNPITKTNLGNMTKRYVFYRDNQWLKIKQEFTSSVAQKRASAGREALFFDIARSAITHDDVDLDDTNKADPFGYISIYDTAGKDLGIGIININETSPPGSVDYSVTGYDGVNGRLGLSLSGPQNIPAGASISETAVVYFNNETSHTPVIDLKNRFEYEADVTVGTKTERTVALVPNTTFEVYNHNETVLITGNITSDDYNLSYSANATVTSPSGVNTSVNLTKNGAVYEGNYTIDIGDEIGVWTLTTRTYDEKEYLLNTTTKTFNVTDIYVVDIIVLTPIGLVNQSMRANVTVRTNRNDTGIPGISWPNISCAYYNASNASQVTYLTDSNISEAPSGLGNYTVNWTGPSNGDWNLTCNATRFNNTGSFNTTFIATTKNTTTLEVTFNTTVQWSAPPYNVSFVKWNTNQTFAARFNVTNLELGLGKDVNVTINFTGAGWSVKDITNPYSCGDILPLDTCIVDFEVIVPNRTVQGLYNITVNVTWENYIGTNNDTSDWFNVTVDQNPVVELIQTGINLTIGENTAGAANFTIFSAGNADLGTTTYSCTSNTPVCNNFAPAFTPSSISSLTPGNTTNVTVDFIVPDGWPNGSYFGNITVTYGSQNVDIIVNITVPESRNWTMNTTACFKAALPNSTGDACEVEIENTGNIDLQFNITPTTSNTSLENYTYSNETLFTVDANTTRVIRFIYNTTDAPLHTNTTKYIINATDPLANPDNNTLTVTLDVVLGPDLNFFNITPSELAQLDNLTINVNITDRLRVGTSTSDIWVSANISWPNGTLIETVNLTNTTPLSPGATSNWSLNYTNTSQRGINFSVTVFTQDIAGGYNESTQEKNFTVYTKLFPNINPDSATKSYPPNTNGLFIIYISDGAGDPAVGANVSIELRNATSGSLYTTVYASTDDQGSDYSDQFSFTAGLIGDWNWTATIEYYDNVTDRNITTNASGAIRADYDKEVDVQTDDTHYKGTSFPVRIYITQEGELKTVANDVTVRLVYNGSTIQTKTATLIGDYYEATMSLNASADTGSYLVKVTAYDGAAQWSGFKPFNVPATTAQSLTLDLTVGSVYKPGDTVLITGFLSDQDDQYHAGANITLTITDPDNNATVLNMTSVNSTTPVKYTANYTLPDNATTGPYILFGETTFSSIYVADVNVFTVSESIYTQIEINPVVYINQTMDIGITVIDPINGQGVDPDEMTLLLYSTENSTLTLWKNLTLTDFTAGDPGLYSYNETVDSSTTAGSYIALLEIRKGSLRGWSMESFSMSSGVFDVRLENVPSSISSGDNLPFDIILTYFGEETTRDVNVKFWIDSTGYSNAGGEDVANPDPGVPTTLNRNFSSVNLASGTYTLRVSVRYDPAQPAASAFKTFTVSGGAAPPSGGGGGGGGPKEEAEGIPKLSIIELIPSEVHVEKGGIAYLVVSVQNLGGADVNNVSANIMGIPEDWFEIITGEADVLTSGEGSNIIIQFNIPENIMAQTITLIVQATNVSEVSDQREVTMRIFASRNDLVHFEIQSVKKTMRNAEDRALRAIGEGKNASAVMEKIDEVKVEIRSAEDFLSDQEFEKALSHLDGARDLLEHVNELLEALRAEEAPPVAPVATPAPGLGVSTPVLMFMFFVIAALGGIIMYLTRDQITGVLSTVTAMSTVKKKARPKRVSPEAAAQADRLNSEIANAERLLGTMKSQYDAGLLSNSTYKELRKRNEQKIKTAKSKLKELGA